MVTTETLLLRSTAEVRVHIKNMNLTMGKRSFDGTDPIKILNFLVCFVKEADMWRMSEDQGFVALPTFLVDPAEMQFRTNLSVESRRGEISCWLEAVQYLL